MERSPDVKRDMKPGPSIAALAAGALMLAACGNNEERTAENAYRDSSPAASPSTSPSTVYPETTPSAPSTAPVYPAPDPNTVPPPLNPDAPPNPDGTPPPPTVPPITTPPT